VSFHLEQQYSHQHADSIERDHSRKSNVVQLGAACLLSLLAVCVAAFSIYLVFILQWQGPFRDLWEFVDDIERQFHGEWSSDYLLEAYGGAHRIFLPKLLFFADYYWAAGGNRLTITTALLCQFGYLVIIRRALQRSVLNSAERAIMVASFALALFSTTQVSNFLYAMDVQWYMSNFFGLASLYALAHLQKKPVQIQLARWIAVLMFGIAAALCNFTGLMALPITALALLLIQAKPQERWVFLPIIAIFCLLYVHHEKNNDQFIIRALMHSDSALNSFSIILNTLQQMAPYLLRYLASPLSRSWPIIGSLLSAAGIVITLYYWWRLFRQPDSVSHWQRLCLYISTYIIASGFFTAFGRIIYPNSAVAERYQTLVLPWLPAMFGLLWLDLRNSRFRHGILVGWLILFGSYLLPSQLTSARDMVILSTRVNLAHTAARAGVLSPPYITSTLSYPLIKQGINSVKDNDSFLRSHSLGYFQHLQEFALGKPITISDTLPACTGYVDLQYKEEADSWIANGQMLAGNHTVTDIIFVQDNTVVGLGMLFGSDDSLLPPVWQAADTSRFRGFMRGDKLQSDKPLIAAGLLVSKIICRYGIKNQKLHD
jgi:hypothetical protein